MSFSRWFVRQKFRLDIAMSFLTMVNFILLSVTASDKVQMGLHYIGVNLSIGWVIVVLGLIAFGGTWCFGYLLDKKIYYWQHLATEQNQRNPQMTELLKKTDWIWKELEATKGERKTRR